MDWEQKNSYGKGARDALSVSTVTKCTKINCNRNGATRLNMITRCQRYVITASPSHIKTRIAWQSLVYSPLGVVVQPPSEYLWKTPNYWSPECLTASLHSEHDMWTKRGNGYRRWPNSFALNSDSLNEILQKFIYNVQKSLLINLLQSKLWCSNSFRSAMVPKCSAELMDRSSPKLHRK